jgi:hypothetical protein
MVQIELSVLQELKMDIDSWSNVEKECIGWVERDEKKSQTEETFYPS